MDTTTMLPSVDRGYHALLAQLSGTSRNVLSIDTIHGALCHYLVNLPVTQPTPAPLTAAVAASHLYQPSTFASSSTSSSSSNTGNNAEYLKRLFTLGSVYHTALTQKWHELKKREEERSLFDASTANEIKRWIRGILDSLKEGDTLARLSVSGGLLSGLETLEELKNKQALKRRIEDRAIMSYAELLSEAAENANDQWSSEFKSSKTQSGRLEVAVLLSSRYFQLVSDEALAALKLTFLVPIYSKTISSIFLNGHFLRNAVKQSSSHSLKDKAGDNQQLMKDIQSVTSSDGYASISSLCRLLGRIIYLACDASASSSRRTSAWTVLSETIGMTKKLAGRVESDWADSMFAHIEDSEQLDADSRQVSEIMWTVLKTLLFSTLLLQQAITNSLLYLRPANTPTPNSELPSSVSAVSMCQDLLLTLSSLSFVIQTTGGITGDQGIPELKRAFYTAIDILSTDGKSSEEFVKTMLRSHQTGKLLIDCPYTNAKRAFALICIEQLISVLSEDCIKNGVLLFCEPHLENPSHRECYESAHSVILAIFAATAERSVSMGKATNDEEENDDDDERLSRKLAPGYVDILLQNAQEGKLNTHQFRLAFSALVRSASTGRAPNRRREESDQSQYSTSPSQLLRFLSPSQPVSTEFAGDPALAWHCIESLLSALSSYSSPDAPTPDSEMDDQATGKGKEAETRSAERTRLTLALISCTSNTSPVLLPRLLAEIRKAIDNEPDVRRRQALIKEMFEEITERVGPADKPGVMQWWFDCTRQWEADGLGHDLDDELAIPQ